MIMYGIGTNTDNNHIKEDAPKFFIEMDKRYRSQYGDIPYAMISYEDEEHLLCSNYFILYKKYIPNFKKIVIPASKWLVFRIPSQNGEEIHKVSQQFYLEFLPSCKYNLRKIPELEYYHDDVTDFLVAIE